MKRNIVTINTFKVTGKWEQEINESTDLLVFQGPEIIQEMENKHSFLKNTDYTIRISNKEESVLNFRLVKNANI